MPQKNFYQWFVIEKYRNVNKEHILTFVEMKVTALLIIIKSCYWNFDTITINHWFVIFTIGINVCLMY